MSLLRALKNLLPDRHPLRLLWHFAKAFVAACRYGFPARKLTVIAVTGTDGKTTTVSMIRYILQQSGRSVGSVTTTEFCINDTVEKNVTQKTSMNPFLLQKKLRQMVSTKCEFAVVEVSSHGLVQGRVHHIQPSVAAFTNLSPEHLDYHGTMEQYQSDKGKLFHMLHGHGTKVLNGADAASEEYAKFPSEETIVYAGVTPSSSRSDSERSVILRRAQDDTPTQDDTSTQDDVNLNLWVSDVTSTPDGIHATLHTDLGGEVELRLPIHGTFNIENALCAIGCAQASGVPLQQALDALTTFRGIAGRMEEICEGQPFRVFLDFTVTTAAYEKLLTTLRSLLFSSSEERSDESRRNTKKDGRLLVLTSACGNRMQEKRPEQGRVCSLLADVVVVTSDETYGEPHEKIMDELWSGIDQSQAAAFRVPDRREAIEFILTQAQEGDVVAICGMAGVTTMMTEKGQVPWDEGEIVRGVLKQ
jgi:UDP-N-acetylmuramoyl-L-alanyl-D-glutamate--2,6-diaminopimelate ligase